MDFYLLTKKRKYLENLRGEEIKRPGSEAGAKSGCDVHV